MPTLRTRKSHKSLIKRNLGPKAGKAEGNEGRKAGSNEGELRNLAKYFGPMSRKPDRCPPPEKDGASDSSTETLKGRKFPATTRTPFNADNLHLHFFSFFSLISLIADGPHHYHPACGHKGSSHLSPVHALRYLSRCKLSTLTTRQPMVEFYLLTFPRFPLRKKEHKSYFGKNRTHDFRTSRCAGYLLDHSGDEIYY